MSEHDEQKALIQWCDFKGYPYDLIYANANGGKRHIGTAKKLKAEGVKAGIPDLFLPFPNDGYHGLYIEMKFGKGSLTDNQKIWIGRLENEGYCCSTCWGWDEAKLIISGYVGMI